MKKMIPLFLAFLLLLTGCVRESGSSAEDELVKAQQITVTAADGSLVRTITDREEIESLVEALYPESWTLASLPENTRVVGTLTFLQEDTLHFGETATDGQLHPVSELTVYEDGFFCLDAGGMELAFTVSNEDAAEPASLFET